MSPGQSIKLPIYRRFSPSKMQFQCCLSKLWKTQIVLGKTNVSLQHAVFHLQMIFWRSSQSWRAFNMLMICFAWERVRNKNENQSWSEKSWINYVKWMAGKMGRLTKTWHLPRPQSNGIDLKGEPKIYIFLPPSENFIWSLFTLGFRGILLPLKISQNPTLRSKILVLILNLPFCHLSKSGQHWGVEGQ